MKTIKKSLLFILVVVTLAACSGRLSDGKMVDILTDFYLYSELPASGQVAVKDSVSLPLSLFEKYHISQAQFETTMQWYAAHPEALKELFEKVRDRITEKILLCEQAIEADEAARSLWQGESRLEIDSLQVPEKFSFFLPVDTLGHYTLKASVALFSNDSTVAPVMMGYFLSHMEQAVPDTIDKQTIVFEKSDNPKIYTLKFTVKDTNVNAFEGFWLSVSDDTTAARQHILLEKMYIFFQKDTVQTPSVSDTLQLPFDKSIQLDTNRRKLLNIRNEFRRERAFFKPDIIKEAN